MDIHYLKVALRNLWKYRTQNAISILSLSAGFICFALSALWIRYELTYDNFHDGADRIYYVRTKHYADHTGLDPKTPQPLAGYLERNYPEIESSCSFISKKEVLETGNSKDTIHSLVMDSSFFRVFHVEVIAGNLDFVQPESGNIALTENYARRLFPNGQVLGRKVKVDGEECEVSAIVSGWSSHTTIPYDLLRPASRSSMEGGWDLYQWTTFAKLKPHTNHKALIKRLQEKRDENYGDGATLTPLAEKRYDRPAPWESGYMRMAELRLFLWAGALLIIGALLNYWGIFSSLLRIRHREMALRLVNGSSWWEVWKLLCTDVLLLLGIAMGIGMVGIELLMPKFTELAQIESSRLHIYIETLLYSGVVVLTALIFLSFSVYYLRRNSLYRTLSTKTSKKHGKDYFRKGYLLLQLVISLGFIFCTSVMLKQVHHLKHTDIGLKRENRATLFVLAHYAEPVLQRIKQLPQVVRIVDKGNPLFPRGMENNEWAYLDDWQGKPENVKDPISIDIIEMTQEMFDFYGIQVIEGEMPNIIPDDDSGLINETLARQLQVEQPIGMVLPEIGIVVRGIVPDFHIHPTLPPTAMAFKMPEKGKRWPTIIMLEYQGDWEKCKKSIDQICKTIYPKEEQSMPMLSADENFENYLKNEQRLMNLLSIVSAVCILISISGVYSLTALQCEQRRKEIAIRKVNGAKANDILHMFFREYLWLLLIAAVIAFPIGTLLMKRWLEQYTLQTTLSPWVYLGILAAVAAALYGSMAWCVGRAVRQNPAEVIKSN